MKEPIFLKLNDIIYIHRQETEYAGHSDRIRDFDALKAPIDVPKVTYQGKFLMSIFEMSATYISSICVRHPFLDGNKRTAALSAIIFPEVNGYDFEGKYPEELADKILDYVSKKK